MKLREANNIIANAKASMAVDGIKLPAGLETEGARLLTSGFGYDGFVHTLTGTPGFSAGALFTRLIEVCADACPAAFDAELLIAIHKKLYADQSSAAGVLRKCDMRQDGSSFTDHRYIPGSLKRLLNKLSAVGDSRRAGKNEFCTLLTHYYTELYLLAPFEQGNGPTRRAFFWLFARSKGFTVDWFKVPPRTFAEAESLAFATDNVTELYNCLFSAVTYFNHTFDLPENVRIEKRARPAARPAAKPVRQRGPVVRPVKKPPEPKVQAVSPELIEDLKRQLKAELIKELAAASDDGRAADASGFGQRAVPVQRVTPTGPDRSAERLTPPADPAARAPFGPSAPTSQPPPDDPPAERSPFDPLYREPPAPSQPALELAAERSPFDPLYKEPAPSLPLQEQMPAGVLPVGPVQEPPEPAEPADRPAERNTSVTIEPPIERNPKPSRSTVRRRERADKLKQKIEKLRQNLEDLLQDDE